MNSMKISLWMNRILEEELLEKGTGLYWGLKKIDRNWEGMLEFCIGIELLNSTY